MYIDCESIHIKFGSKTSLLAGLLRQSVPHSCAVAVEYSSEKITSNLFVNFKISTYYLLTSTSVVQGESTSM